MNSPSLSQQIAWAREAQKARAEKCQDIDEQIWLVQTHITNLKKSLPSAIASGATTKEQADRKMAAAQGAVRTLRMVKQYMDLFAGMAVSDE